MSIKHRTVAGAIAIAMAGPLIVSTPAKAERELDGATVFQDNCGRCHQPRTPGDLSRDGWRAVAFHMRVKANLSRPEFRALEAFLVPQTDDSVGLGNPVEDNATIAQNCQICHDSARIQDAVDLGRTTDQWIFTLTRMRTYGAKIDAAQADQLARWLAEEAPKRSP